MRIPLTPSRGYFLPGGGPPPARHLGRALPRTDADLERLATITPADVHAARVLWEELAPERYRGLIEAKVDVQKDAP